MALKLHTGAYTATKQELRRVRTSEPTKTWQPVDEARGEAGGEAEIVVQGAA